MLRSITIPNRPLTSAKSVSLFNSAKLIRFKRKMESTALDPGASKSPANAAYVQIVENKREGAAVRQTVIANLGRTDELAASGALASLLASGAKLTDQVLLINALAEDVSGALSASAKRIGGPLLFGKIWERLGIGDVLSGAAEGPLL